jgi:glucose-1-phosphate thymidylyltransferase
MNRKGIFTDVANVVEIKRNVKSLTKGGLEIIDVNCIYRQYGQMNVEVLWRGMVWLGTGTHDSLLEANQIVAALKKHQGLKVACLEAITSLSGWLIDAQLEAHTYQLGKSGYGEYPKSLVTETVISRSKI